MTTRNFRDLIAWQKAMDLVEEVYVASSRFPRDELYGLTSQLRRAAISIPCNIAEGQGRRTSGEFVHFLSVAHGSLREVETQILIAERLKYVSAERTEHFIALTAEIGRLLSGLSSSLRARETGRSV
jgi:four helix bundle protein